MIKLILIFTLVPIVELALLIKLGSHVGVFPTVGIVLITGVLGAALARRQGLGVLRQIQTELASGRLAAASIVDGLIVLLAGVLLVTPGVLTDAVGFLCLVPATRKMVKALIWRQLERAVRNRKVHVSMHFDTSGRGARPGPVYDLRPKADPKDSLPGPPPEV